MMMSFAVSVMILGGKIACQCRTRLGRVECVRVGRYAQKVRGGSLVPAKGPFRLECLPQTVNRVLVQQADVSAIWHDLRGLVVHACQRSIRRLHDLLAFGR